MSPSRDAAFAVLRAVECARGLAGDLLLERLAGFDARDAALAQEIVLGALRRQAQLDWLIAETTHRDPARLDAEVRVALRIGLYQLRHLDRVPPHAAVGESVELVKRARKRSAAALVNAVLRRAPRGEVAWPDRATALSVPAWMLDGWTAQFGAEIAERIAETFLSPPVAYIRVPEGAVPPAGAVPVAGIAGCYRAAAAEGFRRQDASSQAVVPMLGLAPGMTFLDLCAAPGNKTAQALETVAPADTVACDASLRRARLMHQSGVVAGCRVVVADGAQPLPFRRAFDRILVDAPCSGTGTLGRNPEIRWRLQPADLETMHRRQAALLANALGAVAPGGRVVYSTCSLERRENRDVVREVLENAPARFRVVAEMERLPGRDEGDGFFAVALERDAEAGGA